MMSMMSTFHMSHMYSFELKVSAPKGGLSKYIEQMLKFESDILQ